MRIHPRASRLRGKRRRIDISHYVFYPISDDEFLGFWMGYYVIGADDLQYNDCRTIRGCIWDRCKVDGTWVDTVLGG